MCANWDEAAHQRYIKFMESYNVLNSPCVTRTYNHYYYVYVPEAQVPLFTANHFEAITKLEYPPIYGKQLMRLTMSYQMSKKSFLKRIFTFYQQPDLIIPEQHTHSKRWDPKQ